jgi:hypothetical protein
MQVGNRSSSIDSVGGGGGKQQLPPCRSLRQCGNVR